MEMSGMAMFTLWMMMRQVVLAMQTGGGSSQPSYHDIWSVLDRYGLPMAILSIMFWFGYRVFWPFMISLVTANQELMKTELAQSRQEMKTQGEAFVAALSRRDEILKAEFNRLHDRLDRDFGMGRKDRT